MRELLKKRALVLMIASVVFLALLALAVAGSMFFIQGRLLKSFFSSYVHDMVRSLSNSFSLRSPNEHNDRGLGHHFFSVGPSFPGGSVLLFSNDGKILGASPGALEFKAFIEKSFDQTTEYREVDYREKKYIVIQRKIQPEHRAFFVLPRENVYASFIGSYRLLIGILVALIAALLAVAFGLWRYLVSPIRSMAENIQKFNWGQENPSFSPADYVPEVNVLRETLYRLAETAVERERLKENYIKDMVAIQEKERERFSRELHDGPLQYVTAAIRRIQIVAALLRNNTVAAKTETIAENLSEAERAAQFSADEMRDLCDEMSPSWLNLGLVEAFVELTERASRHDGLLVRLTSSPEVKTLNLNQEKSLTLLRVFQEAYSNAIRHGKAKEIDVDLLLSGERLSLQIKDDGCGFNTNIISSGELREKGHRGIANMLERLTLSGGGLEIQSSQGKGCLIRAFIAVDQKGKAAEHSSTTGMAL